MSHSKRWIFVVSALCICLAAAMMLRSRAAHKTKKTQTSKTSPEIRQHLLDVIANVPMDRRERQLVMAGQVGEGVRQNWMNLMRKESVRATRVEVYLTWFFGPRRFKAVRVMYYDDYGAQAQVVDQTRLANFRSSGLEDQMKAAAIRYAPRGAWLDFYPSRYSYRLPQPRPSLCSTMNGCPDSRLECSPLSVPDYRHLSQR